MRTSLLVCCVVCATVLVSRFPSLLSRSVFISLPLVKLPSTVSFPPHSFLVIPLEQIWIHVLGNHHTGQRTGGILQLRSYEELSPKQSSYDDESLVVVDVAFEGARNTMIVRVAVWPARSVATLASDERPPCRDVFSRSIKLDLDDLTACAVDGSPDHNALTLATPDGDRDDVTRQEVGFGSHDVSLLKTDGMR